MIFEPAYISYYNRIWKLMKVNFYLFLALSIITIPISNYAFLFAFLILIVFYLHARKLNIYYTSKLSIDTLSNQIEIEVFRYNDFCRIEKYDLETLNVQLIDIDSSITNLYQIGFYDKISKMLLYKQPSIGAWDLKTLLEIYELIKQKKGETSNTIWYKKRLKQYTTSRIFK